MSKWYWFEEGTEYWGGPFETRKEVEEDVCSNGVDIFSVTVVEARMLYRFTQKLEPVEKGVSDAD